MTFKLESPDAESYSAIGNTHRAGERVRIIRGVGYTNSRSIADWAAEHGYTVTDVDEIPTSYIDSVSTLDRYNAPTRLSAPDAADPNQRYRFTGSDGHTQIDVRDVLTGATSAN